MSGEAASIGPTLPGPDLMLLFSVAGHTLNTELTAALTELGVGPRGHCVLSHALGGELTQSRLAELCALDKTTMVVTIDELEKAGLALRRPSATDRRARLISVTEQGRAVAAQGRAIVAGIYADVLASLPPDEREVFVRAFTRLAEGRLSTPVPCDRPVRRRGA